MIKYLIIGTAIFLFGVGGVNELLKNYSVQSNEVQAMSVRSEQEIEQDLIEQNVEQVQIERTVRENQHVSVQVNDWLIVQGYCSDGSIAVVNSYPDAVVFECE